MKSFILTFSLFLGLGVAAWATDPVIRLMIQLAFAQTILAIATPS
jgi:hypothetical protein